DNHIQAAVPKNLITHFKDRLHEWRIFTFKHFNVTKTKRKLKPVSNEYMIWFTSFTYITPEEENIAQIAIHKFQIKPLEHLQERSGRNDILTDVIGLLTGVENTVTDGEGNVRKKLYIQDQRKQQVTVTLWNEVANSFIQENMLLTGIEANILVITGTRVTQYLVITVKEGDAYMRIGMFDKTVEKIVQMPISAMIKISTQQYGDEKVHERFENCIGNSFVFKVQVNKRGFTQELTAIKVFTLDEEKEDNQTQSTDLTQTLVQMATNKRSATEIEASTSISTHQGLKKIKQEKLKGKE
ncbi:hypothetical protein SOVF_197310, partial [Spinacia oleracea]